MQNFIYDIPTKVYFGKDQIQHLHTILGEYGKKALLVYGGGSIKGNGIYDAILKEAEVSATSIVELSGVEANPQLGTVKRGIKIARGVQADVILAVGGGSSIDCAKAIAAGVYYDGDPWDFVIDESKITKALPIISVLTIAATGSEMDHISVISNIETQEKIGMRHPLLRPKVSIMDPTYTFSVSKYQSASGTADIMSHVMESYFSKEEAYLQDQFAESLLKTCIEFGVTAYNTPDHYEARANLMWASSWAINDLLKLGKPVAWSVHPIEHQLSAVYDITHGVGLAILTPHWMEYVLNDSTVEKFATLARNVWGVEDCEDQFKVARAGIERLKAFYHQLELPTTLSQLDIDETHFEAMAAKCEPALKDAYVALSKEDIIKIYKASL